MGLTALEKHFRRWTRERSLHSWDGVNSSHTRKGTGFLSVPQVARRVRSTIPHPWPEKKETDVHESAGRAAKMTLTMTC